MVNGKERLLQALNTASDTQSQTTFTDRAVDAKLEQGDIKGATDMAKAGAAGAASGFMTSLLLPEFSTYGLLGGASRIAGGTAGSAIGSTALGKIGDKIDKKYKTNGAGTTGRIVGGFAGWPTGSNFAYKGALDLTSKVPSLAKVGTTNRFIGDVAGRTLGKSINNTKFGISDLQRNIEVGKIGWTPATTKTLGHNSNEPISQLKINFPAGDITERNAPLGHVGLTGNETTKGFIGVRPYHLKEQVTLKKPMIQIGESMGDGKNATRNQILDFAQKSSADGINFQGIADNTLQNQDVYAIFKNIEVKPKLSEAEKLGIPKGERSNPKALEDPYYGGYQQWNNRYNAAIESGNGDEAQRLRDLHFKIKATDTKVVDENGMPLHTYHGTMKHFTIFNNVNPKNIELKTGGYHTVDYDLANSVYGKGGYYNPANGKFFRKYGSVYDDYLNITNPFIDTPSHNISDIVGKLTRGNEYPNWGSLNGSGRVFIKNGGFDGVFVPRYHNTYLPTNSASQIKSADPITGNGKGEIIPIVKRDNFHNLDRRYKQGGTLKAQPGMVLPTIPSALTKAYNKLDSALTPISKGESKYNVKANASLGPLELLNPEAWVGIDISTLDKAHKGVELVKEVPKLKDVPSTPLKARMESIFKRVVKQPTTKSEKGLFSYVKNKHPEDIANGEKYMEEYMKYGKKKK